MNETYECKDCKQIFQHSSKDGECKKCKYCGSENVECIDIKF